MVSPYKKLGCKILFIYFIAWILLYFIFYGSFVLLAILFISAGILAALAFNWFADRIDREELSKTFDRCAEEAIKEGVPPEKVKELQASKEQVIDLVLKIP